MGALCCRPEAIDFDGDVNLFHFFLLRSVGKGAFGKVRVVQHKKSNTLYALKYINKQQCVKMKAVANTVQERRLLEEIDHPFVVNLKYAFQDDDNCFFVLDLMLGGDLRFHLDRQGNLPEDVVRFVISEISLAVDYLHQKKIVHRDIKPDNILLDEKGHVHLTDFNIAVHFSNSRPLLGVAGSLAYMAPEVLTRKGYSAPVDWWSLGVCAYELLFGTRPFRGRTNANLSEAIVKEPLGFPEEGLRRCSQESLHAIRKFLERDPNKRLGYRPGASTLPNIKALPWFSRLDWDSIARKEAKPPFEPDSKKANFDATHELEELLLEENPLKARKRKPQTEGSNLSKEMQMMEQHFTTFNYTQRTRKTYYHNASTMDAPVEEAKDCDTPSTSVLTRPSASFRGATRGGDEVTQICSSSGLDIEGQIANGGGIGAMRRGGDVHGSYPPTLTVSDQETSAVTTQRV